MNSRRGMKCGLFGLLLVAVLACARSPEANTSKNNTPQVEVGVLAPKTGFMSGHGNSIEMGALLAEEYLNAHGGINGGRVHVTVLDTTSDPGGAAERARELIQRVGARLLIGTGTSASTLAVIPISTAARVPFIYSLDGECKTCLAGSPSATSHYVWGSGFTERMAVPPMLNYLAGRFRKPGQPFRLYFIGGDYVYPRTTNAYARSVASSLGFMIVTNPGASGVAFMRQAQQLGLSQKLPISGFATFDQEAVDAMGSASEGVFCVNRYSNELPSAVNRYLVAAFGHRFPDKPLLPGPTAAAGAYGSILVAAKAMTKAGGTDPEKFYAAMQGLSMELPQGKIVVDSANNIFQQPLYIMQIQSQRYHVVADLGLQRESVGTESA